MAKRKQSGFQKMFKLLFGKQGDYYDYNLLVIILLLMTFGLIMLYSTSAYSATIKEGNDMFYFKKQAIISCVALVGVVIASRIDYHLLVPWASLIYIISNAVLVLTRFIGREVNGAKRWIYIGPISFQPAEFAKLAIIIFIPVLIVKLGKNIKTMKSFLLILGFGFLTSLFTFVFTENLSTAIIIGGITAGLLFIVYPRMMPFLIIGAAGGGIIGVVLAFAITHMDSDSGFRLRRIAVWLDPQKYKNEGGYQVLQGLYAIGSGGFFGKGLGNSLQKLHSVPEAQNDMIFAIICEELGVFGAIMLSLIFVYMLYRLFFIATNAPDKLGSLMVSGIFIHIALQVILNFAVVTNQIPTTGITLPFVSYGGTSIAFLMMEMALALSVSGQIRFKK